MAYESRWKRFEAVGPDGLRRIVQFVKVGLLIAGDQSELHSLRVACEQILVGISGGVLRRLQQARRSLICEAKIDLAGLFLMRRIEAGAALEPQTLFVRNEQPAQLAAGLGIPT